MAQARRQPQPTPPPSSGGPGVEPETPLPPEEPSGLDMPPAQPTGTSIKIGGREFTIEPELASALEGREAEFNRKLSEQSKELGDHRQWRREIETRLPPKPEPQGYDYDTQIFERPREALNRFRDEIKQELRSEYSAAEQQKRNWDGFFKANPDLAEEERFVRLLARDLMENWTGGDDVRGFLEEVAKESRTEMLRLSRKAREGEAPGERLPRGRSAVEGGGGGRRGPEPPTPETPTTLSAMIQRKQARHRPAAPVE